MVRTQIQLPDELYERTKRLAETKEVSLAELVRRGLEYILSVHPVEPDTRGQWRLEPPADIGLRRDPFADADWRVGLNMDFREDDATSALSLNEGGPEKT